MSDMLTNVPVLKVLGLRVVCRLSDLTWSTALAND